MRPGLDGESADVPEDIVADWSLIKRGYCTPWISSQGNVQFNQPKLFQACIFRQVYLNFFS